MSTRDSSVSITPALGLQVSTMAPGFYVGTGDPNSGLYVCKAGSLLREPSHQPQETMLHITALDHLPPSLF